MAFTFVHGYHTDAHGIGPAYLRIDSPGVDSATLALDIPVSDLQLVVFGLDINNDTHVSPDELSRMRDTIFGLVTSNLTIARGDGICSLDAQTLSLVPRESEPFTSIRMEAHCVKRGLLDVSTRLFFGHAAYTVLLEVNANGHRVNAALSPNTPHWAETPVPPSAWKVLTNFLAQGIFHVLTGYDHLAFLMLLLLPSVLQRTNAGWRAIASWRVIVRDLLKIVTTFTLAHSITLGLAASNTVQLPSRPIEVTIAASITVAGIMNLFPNAAPWRLWLAFGFGLVHGFGFANALAEIGAQGIRLAPMLTGFNLGVEIAQLIIVTAVLPVLLMVRRLPLYSQRVMPTLSILMAVMGAVWLVDRL